MKRYFTLIFLTLSLCVSAQTTQNNLDTELQLEQMQQQVDNLNKKLEEQQKLNDTYLNNLKQERQSYMDDYRCDRNLLFGLMALFVTIAGVVLAFYQNYQVKKSAKKINNELGKNANINLYRKTIKAKNIELQLMKYPIRIVTDDIESDEEAKNLEFLLNDYHFENVSHINSDDVMKDKFSYKNPEVLIITKQCGFKPELVDFYKKSPKVGILGFWKKKDETVTLEQTDTFQFANSYGRVYENLMSLLHYMRYLKNYGEA